jgi:hypothetical protein
MHKRDDTGQTKRRKVDGRRTYLSGYSVRFPTEHSFHTSLNALRFPKQLPEPAAMLIFVFGESSRVNRFLGTSTSSLSLTERMTWFPSDMCREKRRRTALARLGEVLESQLRLILSKPS